MSASDNLCRGRSPMIPPVRCLSLAKTSAGGQVIDLSIPIRPQSQLDDQCPTPPASTPPLPLRRPPSARPREPGLAPPARRVQENDDPPKLRTTDRLFWIWLARIWAGSRQPILIVTPDTILRWPRRRFHEYWTRLSGARPEVARPSTPSHPRSSRWAFPCPPAAPYPGHREQMADIIFA
jgi:hypothetical protein